MNLKRKILLLLILLGAASLSAGTLRKEFRKTVDFVSGGLLVLNNTNGAVQVDSWDREEVSILAEIKVKAGSRKEAEELLDKVKITVERSGDRLYIEPDSPKHGGSGLLDFIFGNRKSVEVTFYLKVPAVTDVDLRSVNGAVEIENVAGKAELKSTNGTITALDIEGVLRAKTTNGLISAEMVDFSGNDDIRLRTTNGSVTLYLPEEVNSYVEVSTVNGSIHTDFPLTVNGKFNSKRISGRLGTGGADIDISTVNGSIKLYKR